MNEHEDSQVDKSDSQFGLRSLMVLVAFFASMFAILRALNVSSSQTVVGLAALFLTITLTILMVDLTRRAK